MLFADDILRARLQTVGVEEHKLIMETGEYYSKGDPFYFDGLELTLMSSVRKWPVVDILRCWRRTRGTRQVYI